MPYEATVEPQTDQARVMSEGVTGIVLAGGRSERMGRDKAWVQLAGRPLVQWVMDALAVVTTEQLIVARQVGELYRLGAPVVVDRFDARGELTGIHAGLLEAANDLCVVVACDLPLVRPALLALLASAVGPAHAAVPYVGEGVLPPLRADLPPRDAGLQPLLAAYRRACIQPLEKLLESGSFPTTALVSFLKARIVGPDVWHSADPDGRSFFNVNTSEDLAHAASMLAGTRGEGGKAARSA